MIRWKHLCYRKDAEYWNTWTLEELLRTENLMVQRIGKWYSERSSVDDFKYLSIEIYCRDKWLYTSMLLQNILWSLVLHNLLQTQKSTTDYSLERWVKQNSVTCAPSRLRCRKDTHTLLVSYIILHIFNLPRGVDITSMLQMGRGLPRQKQHQSKDFWIGLRGVLQASQKRNNRSDTLLYASRVIYDRRVL